MSTDILAMYFRIPSRTFPVLPSSSNSSMFIDFLRGAGVLHANQDKIKQSAHIIALLLDEVAFDNSISRKDKIMAVQDAMTLDLFHFVILCSIIGAFDLEIKINKEDLITVRTHLNKQLPPLPFSDDLVSTFPHLKKEVAFGSALTAIRCVELLSISYAKTKRTISIQVTSTCWSFC